MSPEPERPPNYRRAQSCATCWLGRRPIMFSDALVCTYAGGEARVDGEHICDEWSDRNPEGDDGE